MTKRAIGIIGPIASGKDTAASFLSKKYDVPIFQISSIIKEHCKVVGLQLTRENLIKIGDELSKKFGDSYLAEQIIIKAPDKFIVTGMREPGHIYHLKSRTDFILLAINASEQIRFKRVRKSGKLGEAENLADFVTREKIENSPPNAQRLFECVKLADYTICNESSLEELYLQLDKMKFDR